MTKVVNSDFLKFIDVDIGGEIGDYTLPMPSDYKFEWKKTYVTEPVRSNSGRISTFPSKFFVPYFTATWNVIKLDDYSKIMKYTRVDELTTQFYDPEEQQYMIAKFYIQQPTYNKLYAMKKEFNFITNFQLVFAGTMNPIDDGELKISYITDNVEGVSGSVEDQIGLSGDEIIIDSGSALSREGYTFANWNTNPDGSGNAYAPNARIPLIYNITLYAMWRMV